MNIIKRDLGYTGIGDKPSNRKTLLTKTLSNLFEQVQKRSFDEITNSFDNLQGDGIKIIIPSYINDI